MASRDNQKSKVVFVGNVPYDMTEEQLVEVFRTVGPVVGFRLVFDRETGKAKGYGFCEFLDHETAQSAVRNMAGFEVGGRALRVDLADSDPMTDGRAGGDHRDPPENTSNLWRNNEMSSFMNVLPPPATVPSGKTPLDVISQVLATMPHSQLMGILSQMKAYVSNYPDRSRALLVANPQLSYAFFQAMLMNKIVDPAVLERMVAAATAQSAPPPPPPAPVPLQPIQPHVAYPAAPQSMGMPPGLGQHMQPQMMYQQPPQQYYGMPAPAPSQAGPQVTEEQQNMLLQVLALTPDQIAALPQPEQHAILTLRSQFGA